eukprot:768602-Hanusia_phi.AAC.18
MKGVRVLRRGTVSGSSTWDASSGTQVSLHPPASYEKYPHPIANLKLDAPPFRTSCRYGMHQRAENGCVSLALPAGYCCSPSPHS